jgi:hypothetical protein
VKKLLALLLIAIVLQAQQTIVVRRAPVAAVGGGLDDTDLVVRYYIDETDDADCAGTDATQITDASANAYHLDTVGYSTTMSFTDTSGNCSLESTSADGTHHAYKVVDNTSDAIRDLEDATTGIQKATLEIVADVDVCSGSNGRVVVINETTSDPDLGLTCTSLTAFAVYWNQATVETFSHNSGLRSVIHVVIDTTLATAADRVKVYIDGTLQANGGTAMAQNSRLTFGNLRELLFLNRGVGSWARSIDGQLFYAAIYQDAFDQTRVDDHEGVLAASDDAP